MHHNFTSTKSDGPDPTLVKPSHWNAVHLLTRVTPAYGAAVGFDAAAGDLFIITATDTNAFSISAPSNPTTNQRIAIVIRNTSGGALGTVTWNAVFKMAAWTSPADGNSRSIEFVYDGTNWIETVRSGGDVPN